MVTNEVESLERPDWLVLFLAGEPLGVSGGSLDPIRIQKGMFLLSKRGPAKDVYDFRPYNWGPFSSQVYTDLDALMARGLVTSERMPGRSWSRYWATAAGVEKANSLAKHLDPADLQWLGKARRFVAERTFADLLEQIYRAYPEFATHSQFVS